MTTTTHECGGIHPDLGCEKPGHDPKDLGWIATVTAHCATHGLAETWGVKGATKYEAQERIAEAEEGILADHRLDAFIPVTGKIYPLPEITEAPEPDPLEEAATAVHDLLLKDLVHAQRLQVLRMAVKAEEERTEAE